MFSLGVVPQAEIDENFSRMTLKRNTVQGDKQKKRRPVPSRPNDGWHGMGATMGVHLSESLVGCTALTGYSAVVLLPRTTVILLCYCI